MDDIFLIIVALGWLAKLAFNKNLALFKSTPINIAIWLYFTIGIFSTALGIVRGYAQLNNSIFYVLKYSEYYLVFFMVTNNIKDYSQIKFFVFVIIFVAFVISLYACLQHFRGMERVSAPFEGKVGESNTLGGYLILIISVVIGLLLNSSILKEKVFFVLFLCCALPALVFTLSRGSWLAFIPAWLVLVILTHKRKISFLILTLITVLFSQIIFPRYFYERVNYTFSQGKEYKIMGKRVNLEDSVSARIETFQTVLKKMTKEPFFGYGIGSFYAIMDNQYSRILIEIGVVGFAFFMLLMASIFKNSLMTLNKFRDDGFASGLIVGFLAGLSGLLVHGLSAETFILIRVMEPFWFLAALVTVLPEIRASEYSN
jgi:O-antigen ligase